MNDEQIIDYAHKAVDQWLAKHGVDKACKHVDGEVPEYYETVNGIELATLELNITASNREIAVWFDSEIAEQPIVFYVDYYGDKKIVVRG